MVIPTPENVTVTEVAPTYGAVSWTGPYLVPRYAIATGREIRAFNGTVSVKNIFTSD